jgi:hypothetical protein
MRQTIKIHQGKTEDVSHGIVSAEAHGSTRKPLRGSWSLIGESYFEKIFTRQHEAEHQEEQV